MNDIAPFELTPDLDKSYRYGTKTSLPEINKLLASVILLWLSNEEPSSISYSESLDTDRISLKQLQAEKIFDYLSHLNLDPLPSADEIHQAISNGPLCSAQIESLKMALWINYRIANIRFEDPKQRMSSERTAQVRYPKKIEYTSFIDLFATLSMLNPSEFASMLLQEMGLAAGECANIRDAYLRTLSTIGESVICGSFNGEESRYPCSTLGFYKALIEANDSQDDQVVYQIGRRELTGAMRILKSSVENNSHFYLDGDGRNVRLKSGRTILELENYARRVEKMWQLPTYASVVTSTPAVPSDEEDSSDSPRPNFPKNILYYGVPGSGKSYAIAQQNNLVFGQYERVVFHPDFTQSDFVGQIVPQMVDSTLSYSFQAGPLTRILKKSFDNPDKNFTLIIEEINRGNAQAIFGEVFQLLDRNDSGNSRYGIHAPLIAKYVYGDSSHEVKLTSNLQLIGTMNTSDQNVFTLDTAFQRRWTMKLVSNSFENHPFGDARILDTSVTWKHFQQVINKYIVQGGGRLSSAEDKRMGAYFVTESELETLPLIGSLSAGATHSSPETYLFAGKVLKYLWDDAVKFHRELIFNTPESPTLEDVIQKFTQAQGNLRFSVFSPAVVDDLDAYSPEELKADDQDNLVGLDDGHPES